MSGLKSSTMVGPIKDRSRNEEGDASISTSGIRKPVLDEAPTASPQRSWLFLYKEKKEICMQAGRKLKKICECCMHNKISPQEYTSQDALDFGVVKSSILTFSSFSMESGSSATIGKEEDISLADESFETILEQIKHGGQMLMESLPEQSVPNTTLICAMFAIQNLSKIKPPLPPDVESGVLRFALQGILSLDFDDTNPHDQALYKTSADTLQAMLKGLLEEEPTTGHLLIMLEHINFWIKSRDPKERARAQKVNTALLQYAVLSPYFYECDDIPLLGRHVAELALCLTDSSQEVSEQAREGIVCLYNMLLHRNEFMIETPWCQEWHNNKEMLGYVDASKIGQMFAKIFSEQQRRTFLQTSLLAIYDPLPNIREAAVLLIYSLLGREKELLGKEVKEVKTKILKEIHKLETCIEVSDLLQNLSPSQSQLIMEDIENTEEEF